MKSPSELTVAEMKSALKKRGATGLSSLDRAQTVRKYRYAMSKKSKSPSKAKRSRKSSPKSSAKSSRRGPKPDCRSGKVRRTPSSRCTVPGSTAYMTKKELVAKAKEAGAKNKKLSSKTKMQIAGIIKRLERCPGGKVWDAVEMICRDKKVRQIAGDTKINAIIKKIESADKKKEQLENELELAKLAQTHAEQKRRLKAIQKKEMELATVADDVSAKLESVVDTSDAILPVD